MVRMIECTEDSHLIHAKAAAETMARLVQAVKPEQITAKGDSSMDIGAKRINRGTMALLTALPLLLGQRGTEPGSHLPGDHRPRSRSGRPREHASYRI